MGHAQIILTCIVYQYTSFGLFIIHVVDCEWSGWSDATTCSKTCGGGKQTQTRTIVRHEENGGAVCVGENMQEIDCNTEECPSGNGCITFAVIVCKNCTL